MKAAANRLLSGLARKMGAQGLTLGDHGRLDLVLGNGMHVTFDLDENAGRLWLLATVFEDENPLPAALARMLCKANLYWQGTGGATLGVDALGCRVRLTSAVQIREHDEESFVETFTILMNIALVWQKKIAQFDSGSQGVADGTAVATSGSLETGTHFNGLQV